MAIARTLQGKQVLLVIGGGIAAYKSLDLIRRLRERGASVRCILTAGAQNFITPLAASAISGQRTHTDLFDREDEADIGHIKLARDADLVVVAPATANLMAKMAQGQADDLASTVLLATTLPILIAPAMNVRMWLHRATQRNLATLKGDGVHVVGPNEGAMAEAEYGPGRLAEPLEIVAAGRSAPCAARRCARGQARARHLRPDARAHRSRALHREPLVRESRGTPSRAPRLKAGAEVTLVSGPGVDP
jgi:phosphopantothenoylcysteine decarboxylase/phosphopantothenate--cysteine ligase